MTLVVFMVCPVPPGQATTLADTPVLGERFIQVVAHPDDDLLFMSPDLYGAVRAGRPTATVYLTAGEGMAGMDDHHDPHQYARERVDGLHAAYAYLAGVRDAWTTTTLTAGSMRVQVDSLADRPEIRLIFAGLPDGGDPRADGGRDALIRIWSNGACVRPFASPAPCAGHPEVVSMLRALLRRFHCTILRTLDPYPPHARLGDHPDHVASARLADEAAGGLPVTVVAYRGYPMTGWSPNIAFHMRQYKGEVFRRYRDHDYRIRYGWRYWAWLERMYRIAP